MRGSLPFGADRPAARISIARRSEPPLLGLPAPAGNRPGIVLCLHPAPPTAGLCWARRSGLAWGFGLRVWLACLGAALRLIVVKTSRFPPRRRRDKHPRQLSGCRSTQQGASMRRVVLNHLAVLAGLLAAPLSTAHAADMALKARPAAAARALPYNGPVSTSASREALAGGTLKIPMPLPSIAVVLRCGAA